jgi:hypothetical protein
LVLFPRALLLLLLPHALLWLLPLRPLLLLPLSWGLLRRWRLLFARRLTL